MKPLGVIDFFRNFIWLLKLSIFSTKANFERSLVILMLCLSFCLEATSSWSGEAAGGFSVKVFLSEDEIVVLQPIVLQAIFHYPEGYILDEKTLHKNLFYPTNPFLLNYKLIKEESSSRKTSEKGFVLQSFTFTLDPLVLGKIQVSLLDIHFLPKEKAQGVPVVLLSGVLSVNVLNNPILTEKDPSSIGFPAPLLAIRPGLPISLSLANKERFINNPEILAKEAIRNERIISQHAFPWSLLFSLLGLVLCYIGWKELNLYLAKRRIINAFTDPRQESLKALSGLQYTGAVGDEFYLSLSEILRKYIQAAFNVNTYDETTEELLVMVNKNPFFTQEKNQLIMEFFHLADLVKFARYQPSKQECEDALSKVRHIID